MEPIPQGPLQRRRWRFSTARCTEQYVGTEDVGAVPFVLVGMMLIAVVGYAIFAELRPPDASFTMSSEPEKRLPSPGIVPPVSPPPIPQ